MHRPIVHPSVVTHLQPTASHDPHLTAVGGLAPSHRLMEMKTSKSSISTFSLARIPAPLTSGCLPYDLPSCAPRGEVPSSDRRLSLNTHIRLRQ